MRIFQPKVARFVIHLKFSSSAHDISQQHPTHGQPVDIAIAFNLYDIKNLAAQRILEFVIGTGVGHWER